MASLVVHEARPFFATAERALTDAQCRRLRAAAFDGWPGIDAIVALAPHGGAVRFTSRAWERIVERVYAATRHVETMTPRGGSGRLPTTDKLDMAMSCAWVDAMRRGEAADAFAAVDHVVDAVATALGEAHGVPVERIRRWYHLLVTYPGSAAQNVHADHAECTGLYATALFNLTHDPTQGGTRVLVDADGRALTEANEAAARRPSHLTFAPRTAVCFDGAVLHKGERHGGSEPRVSLVVAVGTDACDVNDE